MMYRRYNRDLGATKTKSRKKAKTRSDEEDEEKVQKFIRDVKKRKTKENVVLVDTIDEQVKLLRRFRNLAGKKIPVSRLLTFIKALQRAIHERRLRKSDRYASEIDQAQRLAIQTYQRSFGANVEMKVPNALLERVSEISKSQKVRPSVAFLKRFVSFVGKPYHEIIKRLRKLHENLTFMFERGMIPQNDPYIKKVKEAERAIINALKNRERITIPAATLNGLNGIIAEEDAAGFL
jgi:hypothetical protein